MMELDNKVIVEIVLGRRLIGTFMTIYMPTILLNIISHNTNYIKSFYFEAILTVNLTVTTNRKKFFRLLLSLLYLGYACTDNNVCWCKSDIAKDKLNKDGGHLACV